jgi:hypothetical protein
MSLPGAPLRRQFPRPHNDKRYALMALSCFAPAIIMVFLGGMK